MESSAHADLCSDGYDYGSGCRAYRGRSSAKWAVGQYLDLVPIG